MYSIRQFSAFYSRFQVTSGEMTSLSGHFRSPEVMWRHFLWRVLPPASYSLVGSEMYTIRQFSASYSHFQVTPVKWFHFRVASGHQRSRDVTSCHVTASCCELQPCRMWNLQYTPVLGLLQQLPGDLRSNDVTFESLPVTWSHVMSFPVMRPPPPASYSLVGSEMYSIRQFSAFYSYFQVTSGQMTSILGHFQSPEITWHHFLSRDCLLLRATGL